MSVMVPSDVPITAMFAKGIGSFVSLSTTDPRMRVTCADSCTVRSTKIDNMLNFSFVTNSFLFRRCCVWNSVYSSS